MKRQKRNQLIMHRTPNKTGAVAQKVGGGKAIATHAQKRQKT